MVKLLSRYPEHSGRKIRMINYRRIVYAVIESVGLGFRVKPVQEAIRRVVSRYRISDPIVDRRVSGIVYSIYRYQGLLDKIVSDIAGFNPSSLPYNVRAALLVAAYVSQLDEKMSSSMKKTFKRYILRYLGEKIGDKAVREKIIGKTKLLFSNKWSPNSGEDRVLLKYRVSPELYRALARALRELGENLDDFLNSTMKIKYRVFRVNSLKAKPEAVYKFLKDSGYRVELGKYSRRAIRVYGSIGKEIIRFIETGILVPQDESSIVAVEILDPKPGSRIGDLCAAPGGKTTYLAEYTGLKSRIYSFEIYRDRARRLRLMLERTGTDKSVQVFVRDAREAPSILGNNSMDYVLLDPPCSSTGALARNPDVRWRYSVEDAEKLVVLQRELLDSAWKILRKDGKLLYTVCSVLPWEGEHIIKDFLEKHWDAMLISLNKPFKQSPILPGTMRAWPHIHGTIGFYYALLKKK
ncbi:RsmB/NOP family class I SAM-dependent RNA methyltransferase [Staphylothermus hellenicus]|uniref:Fmu (Sun) domain protein n=1 Tax=Staphylothermus hellenicus (strain DSM 12710 / JCM 10830 / BK20S6-10-b1 / P8) TaxID=591019 RepID=D7DBG7_STAHD|nr:RsmB/NOP family class I SAM-dependent RNA methyltransferase [Staphylothermus hellenicus]ADI31514.1 Fmu (Sun) domain protein [Staphylothermus hellenicus DSM 12710]